MLLEISGEITPERMKGWSQSKKQYPVVDVTGNRSKIQRYKEQYCIRNWNVRSMNQGKLEMVKQEMARGNIDILGISELRWIGMGEFIFNWVYLSFSPLPLASFLFLAICKASSDNHFAFLHFFFLGMVLILASYTRS